MIEMLRKRREDGEEGFTLIELMVVVLIIGILLAIAVPTFLSAQKNAKSKAATANLRSALSAAKTVFADKQTYSASDFTISALAAAEPSLKWQTGNSTGPNEIAVLTVGSDTLQMAVKSKLGDCFFIRDSVSTTAGTGGTFYHKVNAPNTDCNPTAVASAGVIDAGAGWPN